MFTCETRLTVIETAFDGSALGVPLTVTEAGTGGNTLGAVKVAADAAPEPTVDGVIAPQAAAVHVVPVTVHVTVVLLVLPSVGTN
jgi:hypothetical protein